MFAAAGNALCAHRLVKSAGVAHHFINVLSITAASQRIIGIVIERDVEDRTEIEVEPEKAQQPPGDVTVPRDQPRIALFAKFLRIRRLVTNQSEPRNPTAFLINGDDRFDFGNIPQIINQLPQLRRGFDIPPEKNESARLEPTEMRRSLGIQFLARHARHDQLPKGIAFHSSQQINHESTRINTNSDRLRELTVCERPRTRALLIIALMAEGSRPGPLKKIRVNSCSFVVRDKLRLEKDRHLRRNIRSNP
jgi:hypothetical protein